ncbi:hypothetical protein V1478_012274 [Vespula squamosa]|uniref:Uncharacterized protein n=1 Tax=Vespula squamosa TaxID=30214 RepID=A0ABD2ACQ1_VESSQ
MTTRTTRTTTKTTKTTETAVNTSTSNSNNSRSNRQQQQQQPTGSSSTRRNVSPCAKRSSAKAACTRGRALSVMCPHFPSSSAAAAVAAAAPRLSAQWKRTRKIFASPRWPSARCKRNWWMHRGSPDKAVPPPGHVTIASVPDPPPNHPPQGLMDTLRALLTAHTLTFAD